MHTYNVERPVTNSAKTHHPATIRRDMAITLTSIDRTATHSKQVGKKIAAEQRRLSPCCMLARALGKSFICEYAMPMLMEMDAFVGVSGPYTRRQRTRAMS